MIVMHNYHYELSKNLLNISNNLLNILKMNYIDDISVLLSDTDKFYVLLRLGITY